MKRILVVSLAFLCLISFAVSTSSAASKQAILERTLAYLKDIPEVSWVRFDDNTVIIGVNTVPSDIHVIAQAAAFKDRKSTRLNSSHIPLSRMPSSA